MNMLLKRALPDPQEIKDRYPLSESACGMKKANDAQIKDILSGKSGKFLLIIGPCSADREDAVMEYIYKLRSVQEKVSDKIFIIPRIYTNKPRTTGAGYKGMLHQPDPSAEPDMVAGLEAIRKLHVKAISETGFSCADEMLYPDNHILLSDLLSYVAVGARSVENQYHRLTASGVDIPVGMKNPTSGDISVMMNAIRAAQSGNVFIYRNWEAQTTGNELAHAILRGFVDSRGQSHPNYHYEDLRNLAELYLQSNLKNPAVIVDCNHSNSGKNYIEQIRIAKEVLVSMGHNPDVKNLVKGLMIESYLEDGNQKETGCVYGKSITDPCLGWEKTERLILDLAQIL